MAKFGIGQAVKRTEDLRLLSGQGRYTDDMSLPNQAQAFVLRSPYAHARITSLDVTAAKAAPGVLLALTGADVKADGLGPVPCISPPVNSRDGSPYTPTDRPALAGDTVRHVGDPVALIVAETLNQARDAAELVEVDYDELPTVTDTVGATKPGAPTLWSAAENNIGFDWERGDKAATDAAFAKADHVTKIELVNNRVVVNPMEPRTAVADHDAAKNRTTVYVASQGPHFMLGQLAQHVFKVDPAEFRLVTGDVGGGFGMKIFLYPEQILVTWASRKLGRPVKWTSDRTEGFMSDSQGRDNVTIAEMAMDKESRFLGMRVTTYAALGAYNANMGPFIPTIAGTSMLAGLYKTPAIYVNVKGVFTNTVPTDAYRGAGRPEAVYVIERLVDKIGRETGLGVDEIRRRNFLQPSDLPYDTPLGETYDSGEFTAIMEAGMKQAGWSDFENRRTAARSKGKLRGIGMSTYVEICGNIPEATKVEFDESADDVTVFIGTQSNGQGHETSYIQIMSERLGIDAEKIKVVQGDTDRTPNGFTGGSSSVTSGGVAVAKVSEKIIEKGRQITAHIMETATEDIEFAEGTFTVAGTDRRMSVFELARAANDPAKLPSGMEPGLNEAFVNEEAKATYPNGCHICEVEIDKDTGVVDIVSYHAVDDFGDVINPLLLAGQVHGGVAQGVGQALLERTVYDESGQLLSGSFMDYTMPRADNLPWVEFSTRNVRCTTNHLGIKGSGEAGTIGAPPAVVSAIVDALQPDHGLIDVDMPATPNYLWQIINGQRAAA